MSGNGPPIGVSRALVTGRNDALQRRPHAPFPDWARWNWVGHPAVDAHRNPPATQARTQTQAPTSSASIGPLLALLLANSAGAVNAGRDCRELGSVVAMQAGVAGLDGLDDIHQLHALVERLAHPFAGSYHLARVRVGDTGRLERGEECIVVAVGARRRGHADHDG